MWALVAVRSLKGNYFSESNEASLHLDRKRVTATQHNTARGQRVSGESEETWFGARRHRKRGTNLILKESASALLIQGLPVIWVTCFPKVAASPGRTDYLLTQLSPYFTQKHCTCYIISMSVIPSIHWATTKSYLRAISGSDRRERMVRSVLNGLSLLFYHY